MANENIFTQMNGKWIRWSDYHVENAYILPVENASMNMYDAVAQRHEMLCEALNCGRLLAQDKTKMDEVCLSFVRRFGMLGWLTALPCDPDFYHEQHTYLRFSGFVSTGKLVNTKEYISCFFPLGTERLQSSVGELVGRDNIYNKVFSSTYGEPVSWTASLFLQLYEHFCCAEEVRREDIADSERKRLQQKLDWHESLGCELHMQQKNAMQTVFEADSLRSLMVLTYALGMNEGVQQPAPLKRCKHCGKIYYNENARSEFCSVKCRNHFNVLAFRERNRK